MSTKERIMTEERKWVLRWREKKKERKLSR